METREELLKEVFKHFINFLYILTFFSGISCSTLLALTRDKGDLIFPNRYPFFRKFILTLFLFLTVNFLMFYQEYFFFSINPGAVAHILLLFFFDLLLVVSSLYWIQLHGLPELNRWLPLLKTIGCLYIVVWQGVYITDAILPEGKLALLRTSAAVSVDALFCLLILECLVYGAFTYRKKTTGEKPFFLILDISWSVYLLYMYIVDLILALSGLSDRSLSVQDFYFLDPVIFLFLVINVYTIILVLRKTGAARDRGSERPRDTVHAGSGLSLEAIGEAHHLTQRETETLELLLRGMNNPQIAEDLSISPYTVKRHMNNIFRKLAVKNRYELILLIEKNGK